MMSTPIELVLQRYGLERGHKILAEVASRRRARNIRHARHQAINRQLWKQYNLDLINAGGVKHVPRPILAGQQ